MSHFGAPAARLWECAGDRTESLGETTCGNAGLGQMKGLTCLCGRSWRNLLHRVPSLTSRSVMLAVGGHSNHRPRRGRALPEFERWKPLRIRLAPLCRTAPCNIVAGCIGFAAMPRFQRARRHECHRHKSRPRQSHHRDPWRGKPWRSHDEFRHSIRDSGRGSSPFAFKLRTVRADGDPEAANRDIATCAIRGKDCRGT